MTNRIRQPPRLAERLISWRFKGDAREVVLGDLHEEFADALAAGVPAHRASRRYWRQALASLFVRDGRSAIPVESRDPPEHSAGVIDMWLSDLRYAIRLMTKSPWWTLAVLSTVALAIAANTTVFSVVNAVMLRPLPFHEPDRLVWIAERNDRLNLPRFAASVLNYLSWKEAAHAVEPMGAFGFGRFTLTGQGEPEQFIGGTLTPSMFELLGLHPVAGRSFVDGDDRPGAPPVVMISEALWRHRFNGDPAIVGTHLTFNGVDCTVVGVVPPHLTLLSTGDVWRPLMLDPGREMRLNHVILAVGRLRPGVTLQQAQTEMDAIAGKVSQQYPEMKDWGIQLVTFYDFFVSPQLRTTLLVLLCAVGCVLLIAAANVANLLLARASARRRELALRTALGASGGRVAGQLLTESLLLSLLGGGAGVAIAIWTVGAVDRVLPANLLPIPDISVDLNVLGFAVALTLMTGLVFGIAPAWHATRARLTDVLAQAGRGSVHGRSRLRSVLAGVQLALATVLLIGAGLLTQSVLRLQNVSLGFEPAQLLTFQLALPVARFPADRGTAFYRDLLASIRTTPGVRSAAISSGLPFGAGNYTATPIATRGDSPLPPDTAIPTDWRIVSPDYFKTLQIPLLRGREFTDADMTPTAMVVIVSQATARRFWGTADPLGRTLHRQGDLREYTVIGVVGDVRQNVLNQETPSIYYASSLIGIWPGMDVAIRTDGDPSAILPLARQRVRDLDTALPLSNVRSMDEWVRIGAGPSRLNAIMMAVFATVALMLAAIGTYGVLAYSVTQRTQEIGLRLALGAEPAGVVRLIVREGMRVGAIGVAAGLACAFGLSRFVSGLVYGVTERDPWTYFAVAALLGLVALAACVVPARSASRVDPLVALRQD